MPASGPNLFHVSAIIDEKRLWDLLRHMEAVRAYDVEVRPVAPTAGLLAAPAGATAAANAPDALYATMIGNRKPRADEGASGKARRAIAEIVAVNPTATFTHSDVLAHGADAKAITNTVFILIRTKMLKRVEKGAYKATPRLLNGSHAHEVAE